LEYQLFYAHTQYPLT